MTHSAETISHPSQQVAVTADAGESRRRGPYERVFKGIIDRVIGLLLAILTLPVVIPVAIAVFIDLGLPIFLRQERVGLNGKVFKLVKFRSMEPDRRADGPYAFVGRDRRHNHKSEEDPRLTPVGRFIRKWSLDELPQLWNVVRGQMSLVGPRPELVHIVDRYEPWQHARHQVKPGVTGLWQVSARGDVPMHKATHIDLEYVESISLANDLRILAKTLPAALGSRTGH